MLFQTTAVLMMVAQAGAYQVQKPRKHFITLHVERQMVNASGFEKHPLEDLLGQEVNEVHLESFQYRTHDQQTLINVLEFRKRTSGIGATIYPFGSSDGATLAVRGSLEALPEIRVAFTGPSPVARYEITGGRALDVGAGIEMSDRSPGWGVGSHAYVIGGVGRAMSDQMNGRRYFAEGGGGIMFGPFGVDIAFKYSVNRFDTPVTAGGTISTRVNTIAPVVRGTLTF